VKKDESGTNGETLIAILPTSEIAILPHDRHFRFQIKSPDVPEFQLQCEDEALMLDWVLALRTATYHETRVSMDQFDILTVIGRGFYGKVMLVQSKATGERFALKTVRKAVLLKSNKVHTIIRERTILEKASSPFVVQLKFAFQTPAKFYLGLEYVPGGDLFRRMSGSDDEVTFDQARLYIAELSIALDYLHSAGVVYRDLKPENVLINSDGHLKLTDFGLAKRLDADDMTSTFCGTPEYVAPEMIRREHYSYAIDWWALGILSFELLFGSSPFASSNRVRLYQMIMNNEPAWPAGANPVHADFVAKFLNKNPKNRATFATMKDHPFWAGLDLEAVARRQITPSYIPQCDARAPGRNFDDEFTKEDPYDSMATPVRSTGADDFQGFSFVGDGQLAPDSTREPSILVP
jgi:serine/threonine protein kinase